MPDGALERARELAERPGRTLLGIAGAPGAGKSTLAAGLAQALGAASAVVVPMDGFHLAQATLERLGRAERKGAPDTFDAAGFIALLRRLRSGGGLADGGREADRAEPGTAVVGETVWAPEYRRDLRHGVTGAIEVAPDVPLVIVEGNYLLCDEAGFGPVRGLLDETWFCELDPAVRVERLVARHVATGKEPGYAREWVLGSDERNAALVAATRDRADRVLVMP
ncbi:MAG: nucleoside/nucleotide kinase family protein [Actinomycetales bacterium]|nr:nucleoside/nucleotide kinase family protein [Actinomycetales bacterium]